MTEPIEHRAYTDFLLMHEALGADGYKIQVRDPDPKSKSAGTVGCGKGYPTHKNSDGKEVPIMPPDRAVHELLTGEHKILGPEKWSPMARPVSSTRTYLLIDDLNSEGLKLLKIAGFTPAYIQETSPGSIQAVLIIPKINDTKAANQVATGIKKSLGGDAACNGADHTFRLPGFENAKPARIQADGSFPIVTILESKGGMCAKASAIAHEMISKQSDNPIKYNRRSMPVYPTNHRIPVPVASLSPDKQQELRSAWHWLARNHVLRSIPGPWKSEHDWLAGLALRVAEYSEPEILWSLITLSPQSNDRGTSDVSWVQKHITTAANIFGTKGDGYLKKTQQYHDEWRLARRISTELL